MKSFGIAALALSGLAGVSEADKHATACLDGCAQQGQGCPRTETHKVMMEVWGGPGLANGPGLLPKADTDKTFATQGGPAAGIKQGSKQYVPFFCKPAEQAAKTPSIVGTYRIAVAGKDGNKKTLAPMTTTDYINTLVVIDGSMDVSNPVVKPKTRALAAHAKTIMMMKQWQASGLTGQNPCFDFDLPEDWGITYLKGGANVVKTGAGSGLWMSDNVKVADIPDCDAAMHSGRMLAGHAGKCAKITIEKSCLTDTDTEKEKSDASAGNFVAAAIGVLAATVASATALLL